MRENIEFEIKIGPVISLSEWIATVRDGIDERESADIFAWYVSTLCRGVPMDADRSPRSNMLSYNVSFVRDLPCTSR
jgi:hypothetical protein